MSWCAGSFGGVQGSAYVRVLVRVHMKQGMMLRSLVWALRAQQTEKIRTDFLLIPTEPKSVGFFQHLARGKPRPYCLNHTACVS